jgi:hypothetical protein
MDTVFLTTFEIVINVEFQVFLLLRSGFHLNVSMMRNRYDFLADFTMDIPATGMAFH